MSKTFTFVDAALGDVRVAVAGPTQNPPVTGGPGFNVSSAAAGGALNAQLNASGDVEFNNQANPQISSAGISPGATGADNVLAVFTLPAGFFDAPGRGVEITATGSFAATANNKDVKVIFNPATAVVGSTVGAGGTTIADTGVSAGNNTAWSLSASVFKYGAAGSNTQMGLHQQAQVGSTVSALVKPSLITAVESGPILIAVTGNATTAASDILFNFLEVFGVN